jgi:hypothetical protein
MSKTVDIKTVENNITKLEEEYKTLTLYLQKSKEKVNNDERALLSCLQKLMPLQNMYLGNIIKSLQAQTPSGKKLPTISEELRSDNIQNDLETMTIVESKPKRRPPPVPPYNGQETSVCS